MKEHNYIDKYSILESQFDNVRINHFPDKSLKLEEFEFKIISPENATENGSCGAFLAAQVDTEFIKNIEEKFGQSILETYNPTDRCLLRVNLLQNEKAGKVFLEHYSKSCVDSYIPTPNFIDKFVNNSLVQYSESGFLNEDFVIFVSEANQGEYIDRAFLTNGNGLPAEWKNGMTKGIALNKQKNIVIYWLEIW